MIWAAFFCSWSARFQSHSGRPVAQIVPLSRPNGFDDCEKKGRPGVDASARRTALPSSVDQPLYNHEILEHSAAAVSPSLFHHAESSAFWLALLMGHPRPDHDVCHQLAFVWIFPSLSKDSRLDTGIWNDTVWQL
jgi:hypothetical protein